MEERALADELTDQDRVLLVFGYLGPLVLFSLVAGKKEFVKWHAKQGVLVSAFLSALFVLLRGLYGIVERHAWATVADLVWTACGLVAVGAALLLFLCVVRALDGERFKVPLLGEVADLF